jgi:protein-disulfide isomerase
MRDVHPHAQQAAEVAEAAAAQGRFWDMHDRLFARQDALDDESLVRYAHELSLDWKRVRDELTSHAHATRIERDLRSGIASGLASTPTFFIDGIRYEGSVSLPKMLAAIRELHPEIALVKTPPSAPRIPRVRWPRDARG